MSTIFISYSQKDKEWLDLIRSRLQVLTFNLKDKVSLGVWDDQQLEGGEDWEPVLYKALEGAQIAVLLVTYNFLGSEFVRTKELPYLKRRHDQQDGLVVIPVICERCPWKEDAFLSTLETIAPNEGLKGDDYHRDRALTELYERVKKLVLRRLGEPDTEPAATHEAAKPVGTGGETWFRSEHVYVLELGLRHYNGDDYRVQLRFIDPTRRQDSPDIPYKTRMEPSGLEWKDTSAEQFAERLLKQVIPEGPATALLERAAELLSQAPTAPLRLRVSIEANASELHHVPWELLQRTQRLKTLFGERPILYSRHASAIDESWPQPVMRASPKQMKIKLLASNSPAQQARAALIETGLAGVAAEIERTGADSPRLLGAVHAPVVIMLPDIACDYGDCRVGFIDHADNVYWEGMDALAERLSRQQSPQQLLVLDSALPEGANESEEALGHRLVELAGELIATGVSAVLTRQAPMDEARWIEFLAVFLREFKASGNLAGAEQAARSLLDDDDAWRPVVIHRLRTGQAWYTPAVGDRTYDNWRLIEDRIADGDVIPIIGPQVSDYFMRSRRQIARALASQCRFPLAPYERGNLQKVAQYTEIAEDRRKLERRFMRAGRAYAAERLSIEVPEPGSPEDTRAALDAVWRAVAASADKEEAFHLLAKMRCPLYLTTNFHDFLSRALAATLGLEPERIRDRIWTLNDKGGILRIDEDADDQSFAMTRSNPQVHHLFGRYDYPHSLAFTEDDYFRFLLGFKDRWKKLPERLRARFNDSALLFLGFDLEDWDFRVLFRSLLELENSQEMRKIPHVAVQIMPDDDHLNDPERAQRYLLDYFKRITEKPVIFVGSARDFLHRIAGLVAK
jgi:hypothetical protein